MTEIILSNKKHGMLVLLLTIVLYILAVLGTIFFADEAQIAPLVLCILYLSLGWLPLLGLKVLGPQEALVLTLFGNPPTIEHQDPVSLFNRRQPMGNDQGGATSQEAVECLVQGILGSGIQC